MSEQGTELTEKMQRYEVSRKRLLVLVDQRIALMDRLSEAFETAIPKLQAFAETAEGIMGSMPRRTRKAQGLRGGKEPEGTKSNEARQTPEGGPKRRTLASHVEEFFERNGNQPTGMKAIAAGVLAAGYVAKSGEPPSIDETIKTVRCHPARGLLERTEPGLYRLKK